ncbi:HAD family hydrolase [Plantactinospora endophytica]|uniref:Haloacid dehalogenase n=1 Tax=Plantactinospora endophytica TaxID=673535 RepID=A0ABQ4DZN5_9ACTN|nr:HAD family hydrolase [Plantactinospora endophytica]GIG87938.1 haloacid dehalogenase [Plantactinospora endophytica]
MTAPPRVGQAGVVFDLDGTLVDTMTITPTVYVDTIRALGGPMVSPATVVASWHVGPTPVVLAHFLGRPASAADVECFHGLFAAAVSDVRPFPGVLDLADDLGRAGYRLGIFTAATRRTTDLVLATTGLDRSFAVVVCGDEVADPKPAPEGLMLACQRLGVDVAEAAYVGDAEVDLECAEAAGSLAIHARWGITAPAPAGVTMAHRPADVLELLGGPGSGSPLRRAAVGRTHPTKRRKDNP